MRSKRGIIEEAINKKTKKTLFGGLVSKISLRAFAQEKDHSDNGGESVTEPKTPTINYEDLIAKARKEEKEKQYKTIEKLKGQVETLTKQHNDDLLKIASLEQRAEQAEDKLSKAGDGDSEAVKTLKTELSTLKKEKEDLEKKVQEFEKQTPVNREEVEKEVRAELEAQYEVRAYKAEKMAELKDEILVPELVMGTTKEEIDASIQIALGRSKEIMERVGGKPQKRTPKTPTNPDVSTIQDSKYSFDYLATLNPASKEYAEVRKHLGLR